MFQPSVASDTSSGPDGAIDRVEGRTARVNVLRGAYFFMTDKTIRDSACRRRAFATAVLALTGACLAGCSQPAQQRSGASPRIERSASEYFPEGRYGVASPRVVSADQAVPRGGGKYLVGKPYSIAGKRYFPNERANESQTGMASYYGGAFHGRKTANGEVFDMTSITAAHPTMPLPSYARVTNTSNGRSIIVRVNDRGPYHGGRVLDVSQRTAEALDFKRAGTARIRVDYVGKAGLGGSDDNTLMATLRTDGQPAALDGFPRNGAPIMVARDELPVPPRPTPQRIALPVEPPAAETRVPAAARDAEPAMAQSAPPQSTSPLVNTPVHTPSNTNAYAPAPRPPDRPFDLGTIPGAAVPIAANRSTAALNDAPGVAPLPQIRRGLTETGSDHRR